MEMNEEEFAKYLQTFVTDVWGLLMKVSLAQGQVRTRERPGGFSAHQRPAASLAKHWKPV